MKHDPRFEKIVRYYGKRHQMAKLIEECGELLTELGRFANRERVNVADLVRECADVVVLIRQLHPNAAGDEFSEGTADVIYTSKFVGTLVCATANDLMREQAGLVTDSQTEEIAGTTSNAIVAFVKDIDELPMFLNAVDFKVDRQIERIEMERNR